MQQQQSPRPRCCPYGTLQTTHRRPTDDARQVLHQGPLHSRPPRSMGTGNSRGNFQWQHNLYPTGGVFGPLPPTGWTMQLNITGSNQIDAIALLSQNTDTSLSEHKIHRLKTEEKHLSFLDSLDFMKKSSRHLASCSGQHASVDIQHDGVSACDSWQQYVSE